METTFISDDIATVQLPEAQRYDLPAGYRRGAHVSRTADANYVIRERDEVSVIAEWRPDYDRMTKREFDEAFDEALVGHDERLRYDRECDDEDEAMLAVGDE